MPPRKWALPTLMALLMLGAALSGLALLGSTGGGNASETSGASGGAVASQGEGVVHPATCADPAYTVSNGLSSGANDLGSISVTAGDVVAIAVESAIDPNSYTVLDSQVNSYTTVEETNGSVYAALSWATAASSGCLDIGLTFTARYASAIAYDAGPIGVPDGFNLGYASTTPALVSLTTGNPHDTLLGVVSSAYPSGGGAWTPPAANFNGGTTVATDGIGGYDVAGITADSGATTSATMEDAGNFWNMVVVAFYAAPIGPPNPTPGVAVSACADSGTTITLGPIAIVGPAAIVVNSYAYVSTLSATAGVADTAVGSTYTQWGETNIPVVVGDTSVWAAVDLPTTSADTITVTYLVPLTSTQPACAAALPVADATGLDTLSYPWVSMGGGVATYGPWTPDPIPGMLAVLSEALYAYPIDLAYTVADQAGGSGWTSSGNQFNNSIDGKTLSFAFWTNTTYCFNGCEVNSTENTHWHQGMVLVFADLPAPAAPTALTAAFLNMTDIGWTFTQTVSPFIAADDLLLYSGGSCAGGVIGGGYFGPAASYDATSLTPSTTYSATVSALNLVDLEGPPSACAAGTTASVGPPAAPTGLTWTNEADDYSDTWVNLTWTQSVSLGITDNGLVEYAGSACSGSPLITYDLLAVVTAANAQGLASGTAFSFTVTATNGVGTSAESSCEAASTSQLPNAPTSLVADIVNDTDTYLTWDPQGSFTWSDSFVYLYDGSGCSAPDYALSPGYLGSPAASYDVTGLSESTSYSAQVGSADSIGPSNFSSCVDFTTATPPPPAAPTGLAITGLTDTGFTASWTNPLGASLVNVTFYQIGSTCPAALFGGISLGPTGDSYTFTGGVAGATFCVGVQAFNATGGSPVETLQVTLPDVLPTAPTLPATLAANATDVWFYWVQSTGTGLLGNTVYEYAGGGCGGSPLATLSLGVVSGDDVTGLTSNTTYSFDVTATNASGPSPHSACAAVTTSVSGGGGGGGGGIGGGWGDILLLAPLIAIGVVIAVWFTFSRTKGGDR